MKKYLVVLLLLVAFKAAAQDTYEYGVVEIYPYGKTLSVCLAGKGCTEIRVPNAEAKGRSDVSAALTEIQKLAPEGWEVFNTTFGIVSSGTAHVYTFALRRKLK